MLTDEQREQALDTDPFADANDIFSKLKGELDPLKGAPMDTDLAQTNTDAAPVAPAPAVEPPPVPAVEDAPADEPPDPETPPATEDAPPAEVDAPPAEIEIEPETPVDEATSQRLLQELDTEKQTAEQRIHQKFIAKLTPYANKRAELLQQREALLARAEVEDVENPGKKNYRALTPLELDERDEINAGLNAIKNIGIRENANLQAEIAAANREAWVKFTLNADPRFKQVEAQLRERVTSGRLPQNDEGVDADELLHLCKFDLQRAGGTLAPVANVVDMKRQAETAVIRKKGLGAISAGTGGASAPAAKGAQKQDLLAGATKETARQLTKFDLALAGDL